MANYEATKYDFDASNLTGIQGVNTGIVVPWSNGSVPSGFLECNGQAVSRTTYSALFAVVSTTYGVGDGSTTFNVPDLTDRVVLSKSPTKTVGSTGGANTVAPTGNISGNLGNTTISTPTLASHTHGNIGPRFNRSGGSPDPESGSQRFTYNANEPFTTANTGGGGAHSHPLSATFTGGSDSVLQPYLTVMYIIKT